MGELWSKEYRVSIPEDEEVLEMGGGEGHTTLWMYFMPSACTPKTFKVVNFRLCVICNCGEGDLTPQRGNHSCG